jgi:hypothetical protein
LVEAINLNGKAAIINGNIWTSYASALSSGFSTSNSAYSTNIAYTPTVDSATSGMLNSGIWCPACDVSFSQALPNGDYAVYLWAVENYQTNYRSFNVRLEGVQVATTIGSLAKNTWARYGPYNVTVSDGVLNARLQRITGDPTLQGIEIWSTATSTSTPTPTPAPTVSPTPTSTPTPSPTPTPGAFVEAINLNGTAAIINGNSWTSYANALLSGFSTSNLTYSSNITYSPAVDSATNGMLNSGIWCPSCDVNFSQTLPNGNYAVYLWAVENYLSNYRSYNVKLEGVQVDTAIGSLARNTWARYGPYNVAVNHGVLNVTLQRVTGDPTVQGIEIWSAAAPTPTPTPAPGSLVKAINLNGNAAVINGNNWASYANALSSGFATSNLVYSTNITYTPTVDSATNGMLNSGIWCPACDVNFSQTLPNGNYVVYLWTVENYLSNYRSYNVKLEGVQVDSAIGSLTKNTWARYGPYNATVNDGALNVSLQRVTGDPTIQGIEIWAAP